MYGLNPVRRLVFSVAVPVPVFITYHLVCDVWFRLFCLVSPRMKYSCNSMPYEISWTYRSPVALNIHAVLTHTADFQPSFTARIPDFEQSHARWRTISRPLSQAEYTHQASRCFFFNLTFLNVQSLWTHETKKMKKGKKNTCMKIQQLLFLSIKYVPWVVFSSIFWP